MLQVHIINYLFNMTISFILHHTKMRKNTEQTAALSELLKVRCSLYINALTLRDEICHI